jgi:uncharacterized protein
MKNRYNGSDREILVLKALRYFMENPYSEVYLREFGRKLKISPNTAQRFLDLFLREGFVKEIKRGNLRYFKANLDSAAFKQIKVVYSLKRIENSGLIKELGGENVSHLILFGSVARGEDDGGSDVDLVVIGAAKNRIREIISNVQNKFSSELSTHVFSWSEWVSQSSKNKAFYQDVIFDGIFLIGGRPVVK